MQTAVPRVDDDSEEEANFLGLVFTLTLPMVRCPDGRRRRRAIELQVTPGRWELIEAFALEGNRVTVWRGNSSTRIQFSFLRHECPPWRAAQSEPQDGNILAAEGA